MFLLETDSYSTEMQDKIDGLRSDPADPSNVLPKELVTQIFSSLPVRDILACSLVCQKWKNLTDSEDVWEKTSQILGISETANHKIAVRSKMNKLIIHSARAHFLADQELTVDCGGDWRFYDAYLMKEKSIRESKLMKGFDANILLLREGFDTWKKLEKIVKVIAKKKLNFAFESGYALKKLAKEMFTSGRVDAALQIVESSNQIKTVFERAKLLNTMMNSLLEKYPKTGLDKLRNIVVKASESDILNEAMVYLSEHGK